MYLPPVNERVQIVVSISVFPLMISPNAHANDAAMEGFSASANTFLSLKKRIGSHVPGIQSPLMETSGPFWQVFLMGRRRFGVLAICHGLVRI